MKRMNSMRLVGPIILVLAVVVVGQIGAMDLPLREDFIELQYRIDTGDLTQVRQLVEQKNLKGHLNDEYACNYVLALPEGGTWLEHMLQFDLSVQQEKQKDIYFVPDSIQLSALFYALQRYSEALVVTSTAGQQMAQNRLNIVRYFLEECQATFRGLSAPERNQRYLAQAIASGDIEAVKLFIKYGMLELPQFFHNGRLINLRVMIRAQVGLDGKKVSGQIKTAYAQMLPYFEGHEFLGGNPRKPVIVPVDDYSSVRVKNTAIVVVAAAIVACGVKKAYDWFLPSSDEQDEQEASQEGTDIAPSAPEHVDSVGA